MELRESLGTVKQHEVHLQTQLQTQKEQQVHEVQRTYIVEIFSFIFMYLDGICRVSE